MKARKNQTWIWRQEKKIKPGYEGKKKIKPGYEGKKKSNLNLKARKNQTWM